MTAVVLTTNMGDIQIDLETEKAPKTCESFLAYVEEGFYSNTLFHRVIPGFMVQGGGFEPGMQQKVTKAAIRNEADNGLSNLTGTLAMARTNDPHSASCQFFVNVSDNKFLDFTDAHAQGWGYCVFAKVTSGMDIVEKIVGVKTTSRMGHQDVPVEDVFIESAKVVA
ncbi:peptidylprolyl isomerase [Pelagibaculum spongiae]|uniref:Peptidyl-prolyl cis-trans isomerase n=1 Tax=Pelagibaculum spongiae TaxID=2080658 RepID=A0A2V1H3B6_9GAMM|nr:peptidylprolyl isomerase [Pelagibaculum spongiae]PVZ71667.1 peptidylprolyl isomerase [Pelagibaculum spongiae]